MFYCLYRGLFIEKLDNFIKAFALFSLVKVTLRKSHFNKK